MEKIALATIARSLDTILDDQMAAQARIAAHLVAAAEAAGHDSERVIETLDAIVASTVLDEIWITDEKGVAYLTTVRDETGTLLPFRFDSDPAVQPQASTFYALLASSPDSDGDAVTQPAQVREIDHEIYKYVGVSGVDRNRIVQVGNAPAFDEQDVLNNAYTSAVMTAVMAAFGEPELLRNTYTSRLVEIDIVLEGILGQQMIVQATLVDYFIADAEKAGWTTEEIHRRLSRIVDSTTIGEIHVVTLGGEAVYSSVGSSPPNHLLAGLPIGNEPVPLRKGTAQVVHDIAQRSSDGAVYKYVTVASANSPRWVQVGLPIKRSSPWFPGSLPSAAGNADSEVEPEGQT